MSLANTRVAIDLTGIWALLGDVTDLSATIASFGSSLCQRTSVGRSAIPRNVTELPTGVAFHCLGLTVAGIVVWPAALVACCCSGDCAATEPAPESSSEAASAASTAATDATGSNGSTERTSNTRSSTGDWAVALDFKKS
jgi:hypothetical protein